MKKGLWILILAVVILLSACGQGTTAQVDADDASQPSEESSNLVIGKFTAEDLIFVYNGTAYPLNSDAAKLLEVLGEDYETITAPSCVYDGEDKEFDYANVSIFTYPMDGKDMIDEIYFFGGDFETTKGIALGSALDDVTAQYGQGEQMGTAIVYTLEDNDNDLHNPQLTFELTDGKVSGISYYAASNVAE